jgi:hypothetical protein
MTNNQGTDYTNNKNDLLCKKGSNNYFINGLKTKQSGLNDNTWSYKLKQSSTWSIPIDQNEVISSTDKYTDYINPDNVLTTFGAKITSLTPACNYTGSVTFSTVENF